MNTADQWAYWVYPTDTGLYVLDKTESKIMSSVTGAKRTKYLDSLTNYHNRFGQGMPVEIRKHLLRELKMVEKQ